MQQGDIVQLIIMVLLLCLSAFFSSSETALTTVNKMKIRTLAEQGNKRALKVLKVTDSPEKMLSAILIGNNIVNLYASSLATALTISIWGNRAIGIATGILTLLILIFGEITPKTLATKYSESISLNIAGIIYILMIVCTPLIYLVRSVSSGFIRLMGADPEKKQDAITEDELRTIVEVSHEEGVIENEEKKMINNVFDFGDAVTKDIMIPRIDMTLVDVSATYDELIEVFREDKYTRIPVYEDNPDHVIGIINMKDLLIRDDSKEFHIKDYLREPLYTYEFKKIAELMIEMRRTYANMVIVLDEYGVCAGMITLEDMLEEIVGDIKDEYDTDEEESVIKVGDGQYLVDGSEKLDDLDEKLGLKLESEDYESVGGVVLGLLDHVPEPGEEVVYDGVRMVVESMEKNRIDKVRIEIISDYVNPSDSVV